ncbi:acetamidase/formamidase family protein [Arthrobacter sp. ATA002]|uniref:acetamidase/formamidase family protein n=1 Tax=Arthrobacter sp. ATA002 TaxID=2991715 RepID=UPI0022A7A621|nr:acetamidase/formamidase family protein [Arthrobacter sp. ATA002]WAP53275.1 acetamidase/formamidase family protein [Arthrobacter sp. ATA002]
MDSPEVKAGTTVYLGVNQEGALFSVGDGHYRQGEGEACGTAVEGAMNSTIIVELIKGGARPGRGWRPTRSGWRLAPRVPWRTPGGLGRWRWFAGLVSFSGSIRWTHTSC